MLELARQIVRRNKALSVSPLKASSTLGAALALMGFHRSLPMLHGSQGCTAFGKIFFIQHFREPMPLQTHGHGSGEHHHGRGRNVVEGLAVICRSIARP
jgi:hypothetical protein